MLGLRNFVLMFLMAFFAATSPVVSAHHSVSGVFDYDQEITLTGVISDVKWINPHVYLQLDVEEEDGSVSRWMMETVPTAFLKRAGVTKTKLMGGGQKVVIWGIRARNNALKRGWVYRIDYEEGHFYQFASPPKQH